MDLDIKAPNTNNSLWKTFDAQCPTYDESQLAAMLTNACNYIQFDNGIKVEAVMNIVPTDNPLNALNATKPSEQLDFMLQENDDKNTSKLPSFNHETTTSIHNKRCKLSENGPKNPEHKQLTLTIPQSPSFSSGIRSQVHQKGMSTEDRELKEIEFMKQKLHEAISRNQNNLHRIKECSTNPTFKHSAKELTIPESPCSHLVARLGHKQMSSSCNSIVNNDDSSTGSSKKPLTLTIPKSPVLQTKVRSSSRPRSTARDGTGPMTSEDLKVKEMKAYSFKALPLDPTVMAGTLQTRTGTPVPSPRPLTVPQSPQFRSNSRLRGVKVSDANASQSGDTSRDSVSSKRSERPSSCPRQRLSQTIPVEFHFATNDRVKVAGTGQQEVMEQQKPQTRKQGFKAIPMPDFSKSSNTTGKHVQPQPLTQIREFSLASSRLHAHSVAEFKQQVNQEEALRAEASHFTALPLPKDAPFQVTHAPVVTAVEFDESSLHSSQRIVERRKFDEHDKERRESTKIMKDTQQAMNAEEENRELNVLRRTSMQEGGLLFVARCVQTEDMYPSKHTEPMRLTQPMSPVLMTKLRDLARTGMGNASKVAKVEI